MEISSITSKLFFVNFKTFRQIEVCRVLSCKHTDTKCKYKTQTVLMILTCSIWCTLRRRDGGDERSHTSPFGSYLYLWKKYRYVLPGLKIMGRMRQRNMKSYLMIFLRKLFFSLSSYKSLLLPLLEPSLSFYGQIWNLSQYLILL